MQNPVKKPIAERKSTQPVNIENVLASFRKSMEYEIRIPHIPVMVAVIINQKKAFTIFFTVVIILILRGHNHQKQTLQ